MHFNALHGAFQHSPILCSGMVQQGKNKKKKQQAVWFHIAYSRVLKK
jgi:hypothetical protein